MEIYLVGGAVRDRLLELPVSERDWVVVGADDAALCARGYRPVAGQFPVYVDPASGDEYALARRERKVGLGHKGFACETGIDVTLIEDLRRRDLTINAMAQRADGALIDPYGGQEDLLNGVLRHVSPAFVEDPLRLLRIARFAARFGRWGFRVAHATQPLLREMATGGELTTLAAERIWGETAKALTADTPERFFELLWRCGALGVLVTEIGLEPPVPAGHGGLGVDPIAPALVHLQAAAQRSADPAVRLAVFVAALAARLDAGAELAGAVGRRLGVPAAVADLVELVASEHLGGGLAADPQAVLALLERTDAWRRAARFERFLGCASVLYGAGEAGRVEALRGAFLAAGRVPTGPLLAAGFNGPALGAELRRQRLRAIAQALA